MFRELKRSPEVMGGESNISPVLLEASDSKQLLAIGGGEAPKNPSAKLPSTFLGVEDGLSEAKPSKFVRIVYLAEHHVAFLLSPRQDGIYPSPIPTSPQLFQKGSHMGSDQERTNGSG